MGDSYTGGELIHLWKVGNVHLPRVADVFYDSNRLIAGGTSTTTPIPGAPDHIPPETSNDTDAFRQDTENPAGATSSTVGAAWGALRDEMQALFAFNGNAVMEGGKAINKALEAFVEQDLTNADTLPTYLDDPDMHSKDPDLNPPEPGADDHPGEPEMPDYYNDDTDAKLDGLPKE